MRTNPTHIGLISDTHGLLRPQALAALRGSDLIIRAGDVGKPEVLAALRKLAPVVAVRGNVDASPWADILPETAVAEAGALRLYARCKGFGSGSGSRRISGCRQWALPPTGKFERDVVLYINPGSAGPRRFQLPVSVARLNLERTPFEIAFVELKV